MSLIITGYCSRNAADSPKPGSSSRQIQINSIRKEQDPSDPNGALFTDANGAAFVQMSGIKDELANALPGGAKIKITLEVIE